MPETTKPAGDQYTLQSDLSSSEARPGETPTEGDTESGAQPHTSEGWVLVRELVETVILSLVIFLLIRQVVQNYRIENHSMEPNFYEGQFVLVNKLAYRLGQPERGDVVVFHNPRNPNEDYIKRIIGLPGDTVEVHDQTVFINGQPLSETFPHNSISPGDVRPPVVVEDNQLYVMGDNRPNSSDSRVFGPVSQDLVVGQAWLRIWPLVEFGIVEHEDLVPAAVASP
ncbi:MAG: signal peptidase I [Caldilineaceae bacterium]|nr:signal peptidase I [Caldilineaceae bacterium]